jgi:hypothetical protein
MQIEGLTRILITFGIVLLIAGFVVLALSRLGITGFRLPGDILIRRENFTFFYRAEDVRDEGEQYDIVTSVDTFMEIKENLEKEGFIIDEADIVLLPENTVEINDVEVASRIIKLIEMLEDHDDVQNVYTNMSLTDEVVEKLS